MSDTSSPQDWFIDVYQAHSAAIFAYALRHVGRDGAEDVVSETFLVAWRRTSVVPAEALPWLIVVARNIIANQRRVQARHPTSSLDSAVRWATTTGAAEEVALERAAAVQALNTLSNVDREALLLIAWDGLTPAQAAEVQGCSHRAFEVRLHRARRRFQNALEQPTQSPIPRLPPIEVAP